MQHVPCSTRPFVEPIRTPLPPYHHHHSIHGSSPMRLQRNIWGMVFMSRLSSCFNEAGAVFARLRGHADPSETLLRSGGARPAPDEGRAWAATAAIGQRCRGPESNPLAHARDTCCAAADAAIKNVSFTAAIAAAVIAAAGPARLALAAGVKAARAGPFPADLIDWDCRDQKAGRVHPAQHRQRPPGLHPPRAAARRRGDAGLGCPPAGAAVPGGTGAVHLLRRGKESLRVGGSGIGR
jgi:hypothetical protein